MALSDRTRRYSSCLKVPRVSGASKACPELVEGNAPVGTAGNFGCIDNRWASRLLKRSLVTWGSV